MIIARIRSYMYTVMCEILLTHWGRDKITAIAQSTFQIYFLECMNFASDFTEICSYGSN